MSKFAKKGLRFVLMNLRFNFLIVFESYVLFEHRILLESGISHSYIYEIVLKRTSMPQCKADLCHFYIERLINGIEVITEFC